MRDVVIVAGCRTPIGTMGGQFKSLTALDLSIPVMQALVSRAGIEGSATGGATLCAGGGMGTAVVVENC